MTVEPISLKRGVNTTLCKASGYSEDFVPVPDGVVHSLQERGEKQNKQE